MIRKKKAGKAARTRTGGDESSRAPLYRMVVRALRADILLGDYAVGSPLPSELTLVKRFKVSRHTIREALRHLRDLGLVESHQGLGTLVRHPGGSRVYIQQVNSIVDLHDYELESHYAAHATPIRVDEGLATRLEAKAGEDWLLIEGLRYDRPTPDPICAVEIYVPAQFAGITRLLGSNAGPIYGLIESVYGESIEEVEQHLRALPAPPHIATRLGIPATETVLEIKRIYRLLGSNKAEVTFNYYKAANFRLSMNLRRVRGQ
jgi:GntR family transcriptional regulator